MSENISMAELDERLTELERKISDGPAWISTGPEAHHDVRRETAERLLNVIREKHPDTFASALSEVMTGQPISIRRPRAAKQG